MVKSPEQGGKNMRISKFILLAAAAGLLASGCGTGNGPRESEVIPGGFTSATVDDPMVVEAAEFALADISREISSEKVLLKKIISAGQQVVAGVNYRVEMAVEADGDEKIIQALVWRKLSGEHELVSWELSRR